MRSFSYHDELIESLKNPKEAYLYLRIAMEEYQEDDDTDALLIALRNVAEAQGGMSRLAKKLISIAKIYIMFFLKKVTQLLIRLGLF